MKHWLFSCLLLISACFAQTTPETPKPPKVSNDTTEIRIGKKKIVILDPDNGKVIVSDSLIKIWEKQATDAMKKAEKLAEMSLQDAEKQLEEMEKALETMEIRIDRNVTSKIEEEMERLASEMERKVESGEDTRELRSRLRDLTRDLKDEIREKLDEKIRGHEDGEIRRERTRKHKAIRMNWLGLSLGVGTWLSDGSFTMAPENNQLNLNVAKSTHVNLQILRMKVRLAKQIRLLTGVGIEWQNYRFQKNTSLRSLPDRLQIYQDTLNFSKNKLTTQSLHIPLLVQFQTRESESKSFRVAAGGYANILLNSWTKQVSSEKGTVKFNDDFNINRFNLGLTARIGFGAFNAYVNYSLTPFFAKGRSIESVPNAALIMPQEVQKISPIAFGIEFTGF